jgi:hypothetical protein
LAIADLASNGIAGNRIILAAAKRERKSLPRRNSVKPRPPERCYSHRSLLDKLGVKPSQRICVLGVNDPAFEQDLAAIVPDAEREERGKELI